MSIFYRIFIVCVIFCASLFAQERTPTISVLPFTDNNQEATNNSYGKVIAAMFNTHLRNETNFKVLENNSGQKANALLTGSVSVIGSASKSIIQIDVRLINSSGDVVVAEYAQVNSQDDLRGAISKLAKIIEDKYLRQYMGDLQISVLPVEGEVYLNDQFMGKAGFKKPLVLNSLLEGKYSLRVLAGGYQKAEQEIEVMPLTMQNVQISLQSLPGSIRIESVPNEASIFINGKDMGKTPYNASAVERGSYRVELKAENFKPFQQIINVQSGQLTELNARMEVVSGSLFVQSTPARARIFMENKFMGLTPLLLENIKPGTVPVRLILSGHTEYREDVKILPGKQTEVNAAINRQTGKLTIVSSQHNLSVKIQGEGEKTLEAPFHKQTLNAGDYKIIVSKPKYYDSVYYISIKLDEEYRIDVDLKLKPGKISFVKAGEIPTDVFIDNEYKGKAAGMFLEVPEGEHDILLRNWFSEKKFKVLISADETEEISLEEFTKKSSFTWWGALGAVLIALPVYFAGQR